MLTEIVQKVDKWVSDSVFIYPLILSFFSAFVFWLTFSAIPHCVRKRKIRPIVEFDLLDLSQKLFSLFGLIMKAQLHSPSYFQSEIKSGKLTLDHIRLGLQNKCLNESYKYDPQSKELLLVVGEEFMEKIDKAVKKIDKIHSNSQYVHSHELLLIEEVRSQLTAYDWDEKRISKPAMIIIGSNIHFPSVPNFDYRSSNFYNLYKLNMKLQKLVFKNKYTNRDVILMKTQYLYYSSQYKKCLKYISRNRKYVPDDKPFLEGYQVNCLYKINKIEESYRAMKVWLDSKPYSGSLVSIRNQIANHMDNDASKGIIIERYSKEEVQETTRTIEKEKLQKASFIDQNLFLFDLFAERDKRRAGLRPKAEILQNDTDNSC